MTAGNEGSGCPPQYSAWPLPKGDPRIEDLSLLIRRLCRDLERKDPKNELVPKAIDYLNRHGLVGSPLREDKD